MTVQYLTFLCSPAKKASSCLNKWSCFSLSQVRSQEVTEQSGHTHLVAKSQEIKDLQSSASSFPPHSFSVCANSSPLCPNIWQQGTVVHYVHLRTTNLWERALPHADHRLFGPHVTLVTCYAVAQAHKCGDILLVHIWVLRCYHRQQPKRNWDVNFSVPQGEDNMDVSPRFMYIKKSYLVS